MSTYGELDVVLDRNMTQTNNAILGLDFNYLATPLADYFNEAFREE